MIEALLSVGLVSAVYLAITASFLQGTRLFHRLSELGGEEKVFFFLERMTRDLRNLNDDTPFPTHFEDDVVSFSTLVPKANGPETFREGLPCQVAYRFDPVKRTVGRRLVDLTETGGGRPAPEEVVLLDGVVACRFSIQPAAGQFQIRLEMAAQPASKTYLKKIPVPVWAISQRSGSSSGNNE